MEAGEVCLVVGLSLVILTTVVGNTLVILAVVRTRRLRTVTNFFVVSLAGSDLLVGFLVMPPAVVREVTSRWTFGALACDLWVSLDVMLCTASILNLCCISLDRYFAITSPMAYAVKRSARLALIMIAAVWVLSAAITCPPMFIGTTRTPDNVTSECGYNSNKGYVVYSALGSFYIPAIVMVYVYWRIFAVARKRQAVLMEEERRSVTTTSSHEDDEVSKVVSTDNKTRIYTVVEETPPSNHRRSPSPKCKCICDEPSLSPSGSLQELRAASTSSTTKSSTKSTSFNSSSRFSQSRPPHGRVRTMTVRRREGYERAAFQRERRVAKSLALVVGGFIICWLPFFITYLLEPFCPSCYIPPTISSSLVWLGWINSAINPFIYALNNSDYKKAFKRLTIDKICKKKRSHHHCSASKLIEGKEAILRLVEMNAHFAERLISEAPPPPLSIEDIILKALPKDYRGQHQRPGSQNGNRQLSPFTMLKVGGSYSCRLSPLNHIKEDSWTLVDLNISEESTSVIISGSVEVLTELLDYSDPVNAVYRPIFLPTIDYRVLIAFSSRYYGFIYPAACLARHFELECPDFSTGVTSVVTEKNKNYTLSFHLMKGIKQSCVAFFSLAIDPVLGRPELILGVIQISSRHSGKMDRFLAQSNTKQIKAIANLAIEIMASSSCP
ncbi:hypothetical protein LAZ67_5003460 [Cordylochernes scorpioides]|uniref:G-protein coupled receptors family 1 profile domain-containing protein n=1 Tax=Cordylochernes scorpioides TaxID=51811 RepID=A0ABY6KKU6_9ARAC|nr:hypothetical protein LAZ67_5003460 [Cordylochernes scorpioides]